MYAIVESGGKQLKVEKDQIIYVEKIDGEVGANVILQNVLFLSDDDGKVKVGNPYIKNAKVSATIEKQGRGKKIRVLRYHAKNNVRVHRGHRQPFTALKVMSISEK